MIIHSLVMRRPWHANTRGAISGGERHSAMSAQVDALICFHVRPLVVNWEPLAIAVNLSICPLHVSRTPPPHTHTHTHSQLKASLSGRANTAIALSAFCRFFWCLSELRGCTATAHIHISTLTEQLCETPRRIYNDQNESVGGGGSKEWGRREGAGTRS